MYSAGVILTLLLSAGGLIAIEVNPDCTGFVSRAQWGGRSATATIPTLATRPAPFVVIHHAASNACTTRAACIASVRAIQNHHMNGNRWNDIGYNFLIGEDGNTYTGRGWTGQGAHTVSFNSRSIGICFIGNFISRQPNALARNAARRLINCGVSRGSIARSYGLLGHSQAAATACPGRSLLDLIRTWPNFVANPRR